MWPDPFDPKRRRLAFMRGTPTNKLSFIVPLSGAVILCGVISLIPLVPRFQRKIERFAKQNADYEEKRKMRALEMDMTIGRALTQRRTEHDKDKFDRWLEIN